MPDAFYNPMDSDLRLKRKFTFRVGDRKLVLVKKPVESRRHVVMKALLWALYVPQYAKLQIEVPIDNKYKPDLVHLEMGSPLFWGEAGSVRSQKLRRILKRFPHTHFAFAVWNSDLTQLEARIRNKTSGVKRKAPVDIIRFSSDAGRQFIDDQGRLSIGHSDLEWQRIP